VTIDRNLLKTISQCLRCREHTSLTIGDSELEDKNLGILQTYPIALVSFVHRPTPSGDHSPEKDLEFFSIAESEFGLTSILLESRLDTTSDEDDVVYLYGMYYHC
jgi:hypothetical protein